MKRALLLLFLVGCNAILGIDEPEVVNGGGGGGNSGVSLPANNLLAKNDPSFETSCTATGWSAGAATVDHITGNGANGDFSCEACAQKGAGQYSFGIAIDGDQLVDGKTYRATAYFKVPHAGNPQATDVKLGLTLDHGPSSDRLDGQEVPVTSLNEDDWKLATTDVKFVKTPGAKLEVFGVNRSLDDGCFLIDAVSVVPVD